MNFDSISSKEAYRLMLREYPDILNIHQACDVLKISSKTMYSLIHQNKIHCLKVGREYRIAKAHIFDFLNIGKY